MNVQINLPSLPVGCALHSGSLGMHDSTENMVDVMPMSPWNAPVVCCSIVGWFAFQPKRPIALLSRRTS